MHSIVKKRRFASAEKMDNKNTKGGWDMHCISSLALSCLPSLSCQNVNELVMDGQRAYDDMAIKSHRFEKPK